MANTKSNIETCIFYQFHLLKTTHIVKFLNNFTCTVCVGLLFVSKGVYTMLCNALILAILFQFVFVFHRKCH